MIDPLDDFDWNSLYSQYDETCFKSSSFKHNASALKCVSSSPALGPSCNERLLKTFFRSYGGVCFLFILKLKKTIESKGKVRTKNKSDHIIQYLLYWQEIFRRCMKWLIIYPFHNR